MQDAIAIRVTKHSQLEWRVWLNDTRVASFAMLTDALDYAELLGCSPRARAEVLGPAGRQEPPATS